jgi:hypothetical protein
MADERTAQYAAYLQGTRADAERAERLRQIHEAR